MQRWSCLQAGIHNTHVVKSLYANLPADWQLNPLGHNGTGSSSFLESLGQCCVAVVAEGGHLSKVRSNYGALLQPTECDATLCLGTRQCVGVILVTSTRPSLSCRWAYPGMTGKITHAYIDRWLHLAIHNHKEAHCNAATCEADPI